MYNREELSTNIFGFKMFIWVNNNCYWKSSGRSNIMHERRLKASQQSPHLACCQKLSSLAHVTIVCVEEVLPRLFRIFLHKHHYESANPRQWHSSHDLNQTINHEQCCLFDCTYIWNTSSIVGKLKGTKVFVYVESASYNILSNTGLQEHSTMVLWKVHALKSLQ